MELITLSHLDTIQQAVSIGARLVVNVSGGKDGQAMTRVVNEHNLPIECLLHMDLGMVEWKESMQMCEFSAREVGRELFVRKRNDGNGLLEHAERRMVKIINDGEDKPFWYDSTNRYCTSDLKRDVANVFYTSMDADFIISCEGIRAAESKKRAKKKPLAINRRKSSTYYDGMTVDEAITSFKPGHKLLLTWYPIFNYSTEEVWNTYGMDSGSLALARSIYKSTGTVPSWWPFHPAYAMGNERVSCVICALASESDMLNGIKHYPEVAERMALMEDTSGYTFKKDFSIRQVLNSCQSQK